MITSLKIQDEAIELKNLHKDDKLIEYLSWMQDELVTQYLEVRFQTKNYFKSEKFVEMINESNNSILFGIFLKKTNSHISNIKLKYFQHKRGEIGLLIG